MPEIRLIRVRRKGTGNLKPELRNRVPPRLHFIYFLFMLLLDVRLLLLLLLLGNICW